MAYQNDLLYWLRSLRSRLAYEPLPMAIVHAAGEGKYGAEFLQIYRRYLLGVSQLSINGDRQESVIANIIWFSLLNGIKPERLVDYAIRKLDGELAFANRLRSRISSNSLVAYAGIVYFFPMFAGISMSLLQTASPVPLVLVGALLAYPFIMLFIEQTLGSVEKPMKKALFGILPYYMLSVAIFLLARLLTNSIL